MPLSTKQMKPIAAVFPVFLSLLLHLFFLSVSQDTFFYSLVYDPTQKTLLADKGEIRVGPRFQADVPEMLQEG